MTTLRAIAEDASAHRRHASGPKLPGLARYVRGLTRGLIASAPPGCDVELILAAHPPEEVAEFESWFPGAAGTHVLPLARGPLAAAWAAGAPLTAGGGVIHAPTLFAPLGKHDPALPTQVTVTVHDTIAWTHPASLGHAQAAWTRRMAHRAASRADAIVVPTHAVADQLSELLPVADRLRVIPGAVDPELVLPEDPDVRASWLQLPERFVLTVGSMDPRTGVDALVRAAALPDFHGLPLLVVGDDEWHGQRISLTAMQLGLPEGRVRALGHVGDSDLALLLSRAAAFVAPGRSAGFGLAALEALTFGAPLVHSDAPALVEVAGGAGVAVPRSEAGSTFAERLAVAVGQVVTDAERAEKLRIAGLDRAKAYSWAESGARVWQLHAEL
ncbi:glycosyltransferase family 4 protein [Gryllotalpicola ginsengisoli]|uniref:glycosyltransferase family 4 protein n=1 Tax=Gryllotalpicola ginsengisoli TaxID=444608 RepID=UPI0003B77C30|nr:glycosyltransferase family 1 protein [Gryllotalpicola ginsengisoli]